MYPIQNTDIVKTIIEYIFDYIYYILPNAYMFVEDI
jgi:hypothetical protein